MMFPSNVPIYVPTHDRWHKQTTLTNLGERLAKQVVLVVRPNNLTEANKLLDKGKVKSVITCKLAGVAAARQAAVESCPSSKVIMLDDDLIFATRLPDEKNDPTNWHSLKSTHEQAEEALEWMLLSCDSKCPMTGLGAKGGNNTVKERWEVDNYRIMRAFCVFKPTLLKHNIRFDKFYYWEDFHVALSLLELGYPNKVNVNHTTNTCTNAQGGVSRNIDKMRECIYAFQKLHPTIRIKEKFMHDGDGGTGGTISVPDMTVYWKKAFNSKERSK